VPHNTMTSPYEIWSNLREKEKKIHAGVRLVLLFTPLFFYLFLDRPRLSEFVYLLFVFWGVSLYLDMRITISLKELVGRHESNDIFRNLYKKFGRCATVIQIIIESTIVLLFPVIMTVRQPGQSLEIDVMGSSILAGTIGVLHVFAWMNNKKEIQKIKDVNLV